MSLSIGIVGLPNVGKSTLFNALTNSEILAANYPFATIEPNTGVVPVPDDRLSKLAEIYGSQRIVPATVSFVDIAGLVAGASRGEGLGNKFLANIRQSDAIIHVVRAFESSDIIRHDSSQVDPRGDIDIINLELILADIQTIDNRLQRLAKEAKSKPEAKKQLDYLTTLRHQLEAGVPLSNIEDLDRELIADLHLLTAKPVIFVFNIDEAGLADKPRQTELANLVAPAQAMFVCAKLEDELKSLSEDEAQELLDSYGVKSSGLKQIIQSAYRVLGLQSYLTAGEKEIRAWTIHRGATAPQAAGVIHGDFERGFIAAQVVDYDDLVAAGSELAAKNAGKMRTEGRDYEMRPGDVAEFRFNV